MKEKRTAEEIRAAIAEQLQVEPSKLPLPVRVRTRDPFEAGANWQIPNWCSIKGREREVGRAIIYVKEMWDLC